MVEGDIEGMSSPLIDEIQGDKMHDDVGVVDPSRQSKIPSKLRSSMANANPAGSVASDPKNLPTSNGQPAAAIDGEGGSAGSASQTIPPAPSEMPGGLVAAGSPDAPAGAGQVVLLVDDDQSVRKSTNMLLRTLGYMVIEAERGAQAIEILQQTQRIDIVLSDIVMPGGVSGIDLARWIAAEQPHRPLILMSGAVSPEQIADLSIKAPMLRKPYRVEDLVKLIDEALKPR
ncbi:MAG: response regulator [Rhodobacteraceae bacterium]|nr:response regulator [Paracoccaceae bacterium]